MSRMKRTDEVKEALSKKSAARWSAMTEDERDDHVKSQQDGVIARHGKLAPCRPHGSWKSGWLEIGGQRCYFRSSWEANYARYLQYLLEKCEIDKWEHEPETFWFEKIKRGVRSYLPDFRVHEAGVVYYVEVKGWMDDRSKTKLKRMRIYHPGVDLRLVDSKAYRSLAKSMASVVPGWS